jgi:hypothetical protein
VPGTREIIINAAPLLVGLAIILAGVARLRKKLAADASPTMGTYINELGGYVIAGLIALAIGIFMIFGD